MEGIILDPNSVEDLDLAFEDVTLQTITSLQHMVEDLVRAVEEVWHKNSDASRSNFSYLMAYNCIQVASMISFSNGAI